MAWKRQRNYFESLRKLSKYACRAVEALDEQLRGRDAEFIAEQAQEIHKIKQAACRERAVMVKQLAEEFIVPMEREDLLQLSQEMEEIACCVNEAAERIDRYNIPVSDETMAAVSALLRKEIETVSRMIDALERFKKKPVWVAENIQAFRILREQEKEYHAEMMRRFFEKTTNTALLIKWYDIGSALERCGESCQTVANTVEYTVLKNS